MCEGYDVVGDTAPDTPLDATPESTPAAVVASIVAEVGLGPLACAERLTGGASRSTWRCIAGGETVIVQIQQAEADADMALEAAVVEAAFEAGVPVPELIGFVPPREGSGAAIVSRAVEGETIARRILRDDRFAVARERLVDQLGRAVAAIHRIDPGAHPALPRSDPVDVARQRLDELGQPHPAFELGLRWLEEHRPDPLPDTLVHGDVRLGNVIVDDDGLAAVIDWELAHAGDPMEDLGWLVTPAWRFGSPLPAAGVGTRQALLDAYNDEAGADVDLATLRWWEVAGILKWGVICIGQADRHLSGARRSHELAAIGRRVCENEHDLFLALEGRW